MELCWCISDSATLLKTKPKVAFHFNFMDLAEKFLLESHVSLKFCSSAEIEYQDMLPKLVCTGDYYTVYVMYDIVQDDANHVHACIYNKPIDLQSIEIYNFYTGFFSYIKIKNIYAILNSGSFDEDR